MTVSFIETPRFNEDLSCWARGGIKWSTTIVELDNGYEQRNQNWSQTKAKYVISGGERTIEEGSFAFSTLNEFYNAMKGEITGFRFKDFNDYFTTIDNGTLKKQSVGVNQYQLTKIYKKGQAEYFRDIKKPVINSEKIYLNDVLLSSSSYQIDYKTGLVTLVALDTDVLKATFQFDVPVRFDMNGLDSETMSNGVISISTISFVEVRT